MCFTNWRCCSIEANSRIMRRSFVIPIVNAKSRMYRKLKIQLHGNLFQFYVHLYSNNYNIDLFTDNTNRYPLHIHNKHLRVIHHQSLQPFVIVPLLPVLAYNPNKLHSCIPYKLCHICLCSSVSQYMNSYMRLL